MLSSFDWDGSSISGDVYGFASNGVYARSVGERSAIGLTGNVRSSEFENLELHAHYGPVFEVNVFPYTENASRQLRLSYQIGVWYNDYIERSAEGGSRTVRSCSSLPSSRRGSRSRRPSALATPSAASTTPSSIRASVASISRGSRDEGAGRAGGAWRAD
jgi:hypothetical protein